MEDVFDLVIIGGGPAGMTAGIYARRLGLKTLLVTKDFGGQMARKVVAIENYPGFDSISGSELIERMKNQLLKNQTSVVLDEVVHLSKKGEFFLTTTKQNQNFLSKTVIVATGANPKPLLVEGERQFLGKGVSYCAICDAPLFREKQVVVVGGGNSGFESAIYLAKYAKKVYILEFGETVRADFQNQQKAKETGKVEVIITAKIKKIEGKDFVEGIVFENWKEKKEYYLPVAGVFIEIGLQPATSFLSQDLVEFNEKGEIVVEKETYQTKTPGLFAAGDCNVGKYKQIVIACGEGAKAALAAYEFLQKRSN